MHADAGRLSVDVLLLHQHTLQHLRCSRNQWLEYQDEHGSQRYGASTNNNWPHFGNLPGQTGDGTEDNKTTVLCGTDCVALNGVSDIPCNQNSPIAYCIDQNTIDPYLTELAKFHPATSDHPYPFTVEIKLNGGITGTATLQSVGIHL